MGKKSKLKQINNDAVFIERRFENIYNKINRIEETIKSIIDITVSEDDADKELLKKLLN